MKVSRRGATAAAALLLAFPPALTAQEGEADGHAGHDMSQMGGMEAAADPGMPPALPETSDLVRVEVDEAGEAVRLIVGPVDLPAAGPHLRSPVQLAEIPVEGWLHGFAWEMRDADGNALPDRLLHHVNLIDPDNRELFSTIPRRVMAAGRETKSEKMPGLLGYPLADGTRVLISAMFAPLEDASYEGVYLHIELDYTPGDDHGWIRPRNVFPFYLDVMGPVGDKEFPLPPGTHGMSWEGSPAIDGRILAIGGHMHDHADWIRLEDVTSGKVVWESEPQLADDGGVTGVPTGKLWWRGGVRIYRDHVYRISVQYTNPLDAPAPDGAMGALGGILLAGGDAWPEFDRMDPDYIADLRNTLEKPNEAHDHGAMEMDAADMGGAEADDRAEHDHGGGA